MSKQKRRLKTAPLAQGEHSYIPKLREHYSAQGALQGSLEVQYQTQNNDDPIQ